MKVRRNKSLEDEIVENLTFHGSRGGWHVTSLVCCPRKTYFRKRDLYEVGSENNALVFARGRAHHEVLQVLLTKEIPISKEGIVGKIDMMGERPIEVYTTMMSSNRRARSFPIKIKQLKCYVYMADRQSGDLMVFHLFGDYKDRTPMLRCWTLEFTPEELEENWLEVTMNRTVIEHCLKDGKPPLKRGEDFECKYCGYRYLCFTTPESAVELAKKLGVKL